MSGGIAICGDGMPGDREYTPPALPFAVAPTERCILVLVDVSQRLRPPPAFSRNRRLVCNTTASFPSFLDSLGQGSRPGW